STFSVANGARSPSSRACRRHPISSSAASRACTAARARRPHHQGGGSMTQRSAFVLRVRPDKVDDYVVAHRSVWPEMIAALRAAGIRNYTIFRSGNRMFGYFEADD